MNTPISQYEMLIKDRYQAIPLNTNFPIGHHKVSTFVKTCQFKIKNNK